ncbi:glycosyltransferase family 4 protein [Hymenobacter terrestris]|uniref:Glycosyltransferase family 4 protein n=1 Tax=Hymenobacter terrestris TaxID=2748310 RepID=A0ABX2Q558_9BACT|nr:glycosyltransferase family 4 protein [Hymenobacter terrestris]NVO86107.1 glycosyltransferase family 4 protein [Hymenobacter terrestris]
MQILFIGENIHTSKSGIVTVMKQLLESDFLKQEVRYHPIYTTSDNLPAAKKLQCWLMAYIRFLSLLPTADLVHIHHAIGMNFWLTGGMVYIARLFGKKTLLHNHAADFHLFYEGCPDWQQRFMINIFAAADANIILSTSWQAWYRSVAPRANWVLLPNAIQLPEAADSKSFADEQITLVYLARIEERKGFYNLMNIMPALLAQYPQCQLYIAGQGDLDAVRTLIADKGLLNNVVVLGYINNDQKDSLLRKGHVLVLPSFNEGLPMSLLEAMAYGLVPITTPVGGIPDVVTNGENGLLVAPGDEPALLQSIAGLLGSASHYQQMSANAKKRVGQDFDLRKYKQRLVVLYDSLK